jgi:thymidylate synthase ThyX
LIFREEEILMRHILKKIVKKVKKLVKMIIKEVDNYMNKEKEIMETKAEIASNFIHDDEALIKVGIGLISIGVGMVSSVIIKKKIVLV